MKKFFLLLLLLGFITNIANAGIITRPTKTTGGTSYTDATIPHASDFNGDIDTVYTLVNGALDNSNIAVGAAIAGSKFVPQFTANPTVTTAAVPCFVNIDSSLGTDLKQWRICQNAGVLSVATYTDAGAVIITPLSIVRATGNATFLGTLTATAITGTTLNLSGLFTANGGLIVASGGLTVTPLTANSFLYSGAAGLLTTTAAPTNGQLFIGSTGAAPVKAALTGTVNEITVTNAAGSITLDIPDSPVFTTPTINSGVLVTSTVAADPSVALGVASKQYVDANGFTTGDVKITIKTVADTGFVLMNDGSIGNAASGGTTRANADTSALFTLLWNNCANAQCAVSTGRGASAAADFAANKNITLPLALGRALATFGTGAGLTARVMGQTLGEENHLLTTAEMPAHVHQEQIANTQSSVTAALSFTTVGGATTAGIGASTTAANATAALNTLSTGGGGTHNVMQPTLFLNIMIKL